MPYLGKIGQILKKVRKPYDVSSVALQPSDVELSSTSFLMED